MTVPTWYMPAFVGEMTTSPSLSPLQVVQSIPHISPAPILVTVGSPADHLRYEAPVELAPVVGQLVGEVLTDPEVDTEEAAVDALVHA